VGLGLVLLLPAPLRAAVISRNPGAHRPHVIYVSPDGRDSNPGTASRPLRTLSRAQAVVRKLIPQMRADVDVYLESGFYRLATPLRFGVADSGTGGHDVVWSSVPGQTAVIAGSKRIAGWKQSGERRGVWVARVPKTLNFAQLYVNGVRAWDTFGAIPVRLRETPTGYIASSSIMASWRNPSSLEFVYLHGLGQFSEPRCPIASIVGNVVTMAQPCWNNISKRLPNLVTFRRDVALNLPTSLQNAYELLNQPGEFYLDRARHLLYYAPRPGENMRDADVEAPVLQTLVEGAGTAAAPVHNIVFSNIQFSYATWLQPLSTEGFAEVQAGYTITGADGYRTEGLCAGEPGGTCPYGAWTKERGNIQFEYDSHVSFRADRFVHLGGAGLDLGDGTQYALVADSVFTDISGNGLELGGVDASAVPPSSQTLDDVIANNHVYNIGVEYHGSVGVLIGYVAGCTVTHNQIDHVPYTAISIGWGGWLDKIGKPPVVSYARRDVISYNLIYDCLQVLSDGAGIYNLGLEGTSLRNGLRVIDNVVHDPLEWGWALKSDDASGYITYERNVVYGAAYGWDAGQPDTINNDGQDYPQLIKNNFWQQQIKDPYPGVVQSGNSFIVGPSDAPRAITRLAGVTSRDRGLLSWKPNGESPPSAPMMVTPLYAYMGRAYVTWHPSFDLGTRPVLAYKVVACHVSPDEIPESCRSGPSVTESSADLNRRGYAVVSGLHDGRDYSFSVVAQSAHGLSPWSIPSKPVYMSSQAPARPGATRSLTLEAKDGLIRLGWYPPLPIGTVRPLGRRAGAIPDAAQRSATWAPVLSYVAVASNGNRYVFTGHGRVILWAHGAKGVAVLAGFAPGRTYRFTVWAVDPSGSGPTVSATVRVPQV
jgi:hypothetical protein